MHSIIEFKRLYRFLSNFHPSPILYHNEIYPTAEHLFQALKTRNDKTRSLIRELKYPSEARSKGRQIELRSDWEQVKNKAMTLVVKLKFSQDDKLKNRFLKTKERLLIEGNYWHDNYWGKCSCPRCRHIYGQNQLGKILMKLREEFQQKND